MNTQTQAEYDRIEAGPHEGEFTFLHHDGPIIEHTDDVMVRVREILERKYPWEHYDRLRRIHYLEPSMIPEGWRAAVAARRAAWAVFQAKDAVRHQAYNAWKLLELDERNLSDTPALRRLIPDWPAKEEELIWRLTV